MPGKNFGFVFSQADLQYFPEKRRDIIAFLKTLTDDRVRYEKAPFDHPEIKIPHGHADANAAILKSRALAPNLADDEYLTIEAVGANGRQEPLPPFEAYLD